MTTEAGSEATSRARTWLEVAHDLHVRVTRHVIGVLQYRQLLRRLVLRWQRLSLVMRT